MFAHSYHSALKNFKKIAQFRLTFFEIYSSLCSLEEQTVCEFLKLSLFINSFVIITFVSDFGALSIHYIPNNKDIIHQFCQVPDSALNFLYCDTISKFVDITYTTLKKGKSNFVCSQLGLERKYRYRV